MRSDVCTIYCFLTILFPDLVGCVEELQAEITLGRVLLIIAVVAIKKALKKSLSVQKKTSTDTCITIIVTRLIRTPLSRNLD